MAKRSALFCVPLLAAGVLVTVAAPAGANLPPGATPVPVSAGIDSSGIVAHLDGAASIAGTIAAAAGGAVNATVTAFLGNKQVGAAFASGGPYLIGGLKASATGYVVCVSPFAIFGGNSTTGYLGRCWKTAAYDGTAIPAGATKVPLSPGQPKANINITVPSSAAISGRVTAGAGNGINGVNVIATNKDNGSRHFGFTNTNGVYKLTGLPASSKGYTVCADPSFTVAGTTGFRPRCWKNVAWGGGSIPSAATPVSVSLGHTHTGINISLERGAAVSGALTDAGNANPLKGAGVAAYTASGRFLTSTTTNSTGHYTLKGLPASSTLRVCAYPFNPSTAVTYAGKCWKNVAWNGGSLPSGTTAISTALGQTRAGISLKLRKTVIQLGSIAGTVTEQLGDTAVEDARVDLFRSSGGFVDEKMTDPSGHYTFSGLKPDSTGYVVCVQAIADTFTPTGTTPGTGWAPRCDGDVPWNTVRVPGSADRLALSPGQNITAVDVSLHVGGEISGSTNTTGLKTSPIANVTVKVFNGAEQLVATGTSAFDGSFAFKDLLPNSTGYFVCFDGRHAVFGGAGYLPECWQDQPWSGTP